MALKSFVKDLVEVPEAFRTAYAKLEDGTGFVLDLEDKEFGALRGKLDEFRGNNRKLFEERKTLEANLAKFEGIDPEKYKEAQARLQKLDQLEDGALLKEGKLEEVIAKRVEAMKSSYEGQLKSKDKALSQATEALEQYRTNLNNLTIETQVNKAISKVGQVRAGAMHDVLNRARSTFKIDDAGKLIATNPDGTQRFGPKGEPLTMEEWGQGLLQDATYLFEGGAGGGAGGGRKGDGMNLPAKTIRKGDGAAFTNNLEKIAKGEVMVSSQD